MGKRVVCDPGARVCYEAPDGRRSRQLCRRQLRRVVIGPAATVIAALAVVDVLVLTMLFTTGDLSHIAFWHGGMLVFVVAVGLALLLATQSLVPAVILGIWMLFGVEDLLYAVVASAAGYQWPLWEWLDPAFRWDWLDRGLLGLGGLIPVTTMTLLVFVVVGIALSLGLFGLWVSRRCVSRARRA